MSEPVSPARPATHRRGRPRRSPAERSVYEQVRSAVAVSLVTVPFTLAAVAVVCRLLQVSAGHLVLALACGMFVPAFVGACRSDAAAATVCRARGAELQRLAGAAADVEKSVVRAAEELCRGGRPAIPDLSVAAVSGGSAAEVETVLTRVNAEAVQALIRVHEQSQSAVLLELLRHLSRREHALVSRALESLGELQARTDEPELLAGIYDADHLVTRMRRMVESKAVLSGESLRSARRPVSVMTVLRGAVSEVVQYPRVRVAAGAVGAELALPGYVGPELSHLVAELIENATEFSDPRTRVLVRAEKVPAGLAVEVEDRAVPMSPQQRMRLNRLLAAPDEVDVSAQLRDGQIGLLTAAKIARRHGMKVTLHENPAGGTTAVVVVPARLLVRLETPDVISVPDTAAVASAAGDRPLPAAEPPPPVARSSTARPEQRANDAGQAPAPPAPPADRPRLPRRQQQRLPLPDTGPQIQSAPRGTATPGLAAAFRSGQQAARGLGAAVPGDPVTAADHGCAPTEHP